jgi:hypothetical protein
MFSLRINGPPPPFKFAVFPQKVCRKIDAESTTISVAAEYFGENVTSDSPRLARNASQDAPTLTKISQELASS